LHNERASVKPRGFSGLIPDAFDETVLAETV
jgi:hypothetical protein